ncbi:MAG: hypothetical protein H0X70_10880, partial [Segetibacter sp.]|nr:hypothetical protein [Segetibacter sp.]
MKPAFFLLFFLLVMFAQAQLAAPDVIKVKGGELTIQPITHATLVLGYHK